MKSFLGNLNGDFFLVTLIAIRYYCSSSRSILKGDQCQNRSFVRSCIGGKIIRLESHFFCHLLQNVFFFLSFFKKFSGSRQKAVVKLAHWLPPRLQRSAVRIQQFFVLLPNYIEKPKMEKKRPGMVNFGRRFGSSHWQFLELFYANQLYLLLTERK